MRIDTMIYYHGTSVENGESIMKNGFRVKPSAEMIMGVGLYLTPDLDMAERYAMEVRDVETGKHKGSRDGMVLRVVIPRNITMNICTVHNYEAVPLYRDMMINKKMDEVSKRGHDLDAADLKSLNRAVKLKHEKLVVDKKGEMLDLGCDAATMRTSGISLSREIVIYNDDIIKNLQVSLEKNIKGN